MFLPEDLLAELPGAPYVQVALGVVLLLFGRKLFWLLVAAVGFFLGLGLGMAFLDPEPAWLALVVGLGAGFLGALAAVFVQRVAVGVAGFVVGGYGALWLAERAGQAPEGSGAVIFAVGGVLAAVLAVALFGWALVVVSAVAGAVLVGDALPLSPSVALAAVVILTAVGIAFQGAAKGRRRRESG